ncbi:MAG: hypothetical protein H6618_00830 [Deltaproteobacteria bacterium]|nr:hypothetical protein [Deltaproteobacteria bacterium]
MRSFLWILILSVVSCKTSQDSSDKRLGRDQSGQNLYVKDVSGGDDLVCTARLYRPKTELNNGLPIFYFQLGTGDYTVNKMLFDNLFGAKISEHVNLLIIDKPGLIYIEDSADELKYNVKGCKKGNKVYECPDSEGYKAYIKHTTGTLIDCGYQALKWASDIDKGSRYILAGQSEGSAIMGHLAGKLLSDDETGNLIEVIYHHGSPMGKVFDDDEKFDCFDTETNNKLMVQNSFSCGWARYTASLPLLPEVFFKLLDEQPKAESLKMEFIQGLNDMVGTEHVLNFEDMNEQRAESGKRYFRSISFAYHNPGLTEDNERGDGHALNKAFSKLFIKSLIHHIPALKDND